MPYDCNRLSSEYQSAPGVYLKLLPFPIVDLHLDTEFEPLTMEFSLVLSPGIDMVVRLRQTQAIAARLTRRWSHVQRGVASLIHADSGHALPGENILQGECRRCSTTAKHAGVVGVSAKKAASDSGAGSEHGEGASNGEIRSSLVTQIFRLFPDRTARALTAARLLQTCLNNVERQAWYTNGMISTEFLGKHLWLSTNVWILSRRLLREDEEGKRVQEILFDELWRETMRQMRSIKVSDFMLKKYLKDAQQHTFNTLVQYDHAYTLPTEEERLDSLAGAIWRTVYARNESVGEERVRLMAEYVNSELLDVYEVDKGCLEFAPPPAALGTFDKLAPHGHGRGAKKLRGRGAVAAHMASERSSLDKSDESSSSSSSVDSLGFTNGDLGIDGKGKWRASLAESGKVYFWHTVSKKTTYDRPEGFEDWVPCTMPKTQNAATA